jgi:hypothetical protein
MKTYKTTFKHGHFIDTFTGKRIIPVQGADYEISGFSDAFREEDEKLRVFEPMSSNKKHSQIIEKYGEYNIIKIVDAGTKLVFRVGNAKKVQGDESIEYIFTCQLLEDLYIYKKDQKAGDDPNHWRLDNCICNLENCISGGLTLSEKISAPSLNMLFASTVAFYFNMQRSTVCNAFKTFAFYDDGMQLTRDGLIYGYHSNLDCKRNAILNNFPRNKTKPVTQ